MGCAFSTSSSKTTQAGRRRTASVSWPPSPYPTYPGGAPTSRATLCGSEYSERSMRTSAPGCAPPSLAGYSSSASTRAVSVFPTPLGPTKRNDASGRWAEKPA